MKTGISTVTKATEALWPSANPLRGAGYHELAVKFVRNFPIGTTVTIEKFDRWAHDHGYYSVPFEAPKQSDVWLAHLTRRNQLRQNLYKASTHPRMYENGGKCFVLNNSGVGAMIVDSASTALEQPQFASKLSTLIGTKRKQLSFLMQSADLDQMQPWQKSVAETLFDDIEQWNKEVIDRTDYLDRKFGKLVAQIKHDIAVGTVVPVNHGLLQLVNGEVKDDQLPDFFS